MKKLLLLVFISVLSVNLFADDYASGAIAVNADFTLPSFWTGNCSFAQKTRLTASKTVGDFATALGITEGAESAYGVNMSKSGSDGSTYIGDESTGYSMLTLTNFKSLTLTVWGTGGRGVAIRTSLTGDNLVWAGGGSYTAITATYTPTTTLSSVTLYLVPTGSSEGSYSTGDTYVSELNISYDSASGVENATADKGEVVSTQYFDITGREVSESASGLIFKKLTYENGSTEVIKTLVKK